MAEKNVEEAAPAIDVTDADKTKKTVMLLIILSVLVMVLTPVITIFAIRMMTKAPAEPPPEPVERNTHEIVLPKIQVNVAETNGTRFVQIDVVLEVSDAEMAPLFEDQTPENDRGRIKRVMASVISIVSDKNLEALVSREAKVKLAQEIKNALNELLHKDTDGIVTDVYFYGFLIQ